MRAFVLDTSALLRLYLPDGPLPDGVEAAVTAAWRGDAVLLVPELLLAEAAQVLWKKERAGQLDRATTTAILAEILALPLEVCGHRDLIERASRLARDRGLTVYDALFLALGQDRGATVLTADERLMRAAT